MIAGSIARRYAKAIFSIALEERNQDAVARDLATLAEMLKTHPELREALGNPVFPVAERKAVMEAVCDRLGLGRILRNFVLLLVERGRILALPDIAREFGVMADEQAGRVRARVVTAVPLGPDLETRLRVALEKRCGKRVILEKEVDPTLLGGFVAEVGGVTYDGSLRYHLESLKRRLTEET